MSVFLFLLYNPCCQIRQDSVFLSADEWVEHEGLATSFLLARLDEAFVGENLQEGCNGGVGWFGLWIATDDFMSGHPCRLINSLLVVGICPENVHDFHLSLCELSFFFFSFHI